MSSRSSLYRKRKIQQWDMEVGRTLSAHSHFSSVTDSLMENDEVLKTILDGAEAVERISNNNVTEMDVEMISDPDDDEDLQSDVDLHERSQWDDIPVEHPVTMKDIACVLLIFKHRHHLSIECMSDLLSLLILLEVKNVPRSWYQLKETVALINPKRSYFTVCENCSSSSSNMSTCSNCGQTRKKSHTIYQKTFVNFSISDQLEIILCNNDIVSLFSSYPSNAVRDITHGDVYKQIKTVCRDEFLTFTVNIDGVQVKKRSNKSVWPVILVINELPLQQRYNIENVIIAGIWLAPNKPSRKDMRLLLLPMVQELSALENGYILKDYRNLSNNNDIMIKLFLIGACCDKPAQALVQNIPEPTARFGCGRCEISGEVMKTSAKGSARSFAIIKSDLKKIELRSNQRYDLLLDLKRINQENMNMFTNLSKKARENLQEQYQLAEKGILGECVLRDLKFFDVGTSFMGDSLHNVYSGVFRRMLNLWFDKKYSSEKWNIMNKLDHLSSLLIQLQLPSTTTRLPRNLVEYNNYKANELRILLLFGHTIFAEILDQVYYSHLLQLVVLMHLTESRQIRTNYFPIIQELAEYFVSDFAKLYTSRHVVQVVHSIIHIPATVKGFGPLTHYTTFNFEDVLGQMTRATKSTRRHAEEIIGGVQLLQSAMFYLKQTSLTIRLEKFVSINLGYPLQKKDYTIRLIHETRQHTELSSILFPQAVVKYFDVLYIGDIRISTKKYAEKKKANDSNIIFRHNDANKFGTVSSIFSVKNERSNDQPLLLVDYFARTETIFCYFGNRTFACDQIQSGDPTTRTTCLIEIADFVEKCAFYQAPNGIPYFYQFPSLIHST